MLIHQNKISVAKTLITIAFISASCLHYFPAISKEPSRSSDAPIMEVADDKALRPELRAKFLLSFADQYIDNRPVNMEDWREPLKVAPKFAPANLDRALSEWADSASEYASLYSAVSPKLQAKPDAANAALAAEALGLALKDLEKSSDEYAKLSLYFLASGMYKKLGNIIQAANCESVLYDAFALCEGSPPASEALIAASASVLNSMSCNIIFVKIPDRELLAGLKAIPSFTPKEFEQSEQLRLRGLKMVDRLDAQNQARQKGHRDLSFWYSELGKTKLAEEQKKIFFELGGSKDEALLYPQIASDPSGLNGVIDRKGSVVKSFSAIKSNPDQTYRHYDTVGANLLTGSLPYMLELKTKRKIYFPKNVTPVIPQTLIFGEPPTDVGLQSVEIKEPGASMRPGIFNAKTGALVKLPQNFEFMSWFACGRASFSVIESKSQRKWGFLDENGKVVIALVYDEVYEFTENLAPVMRNGHWSFLDKSGKIAIALPPECHRANCFMEGLASVVMGHDPLNGSGYPGEDNLLGFIDRTGKIVIKPQFSGKYRNPGFSYGLAAVVQDDPRHLKGYIDKSGKWVISPQFKSAGSFGPDGTARVTYGLVNFDKMAWKLGNRHQAFLALLVSPGLLDLTRAKVADLLGKANSENGDENEYIIFSGHTGTSAFTVHFKDDKIDKYRMNYMRDDEWFDATHPPKLDY